MAKNSITIKPSAAWVTKLEDARPDLFAHGRNYAIECAIAEACSLPHPLPPGARIQMGAVARGKQISRAAKRDRKSKLAQS